MIKAIGLTQWGYGVMLLLLTTIAQAGHGELQLRNFTPTVKTVHISLQGAKSVMPHLERIHDLISQVLQSSKLHVVRVPTTDDPEMSTVIPMVENLNIHIAMPTPDDESIQPYVFNLRTKLTGQAESNQSFAYFPDDAAALYQTLQDYFANLLDLQVAVTSEPRSYPVSDIRYNVPQDIDSHPIISDVLNTKRVIVLPIEKIKPIETQEIIETVAEQKTVEPVISSQQEIELRSLTPAVKSVEIRLRGSIREQKILDDIHTMVSDILQTSRLSVVRVPVVKDATVTPAIKLYEHLEIIIQATSPEQDGQPYLIEISFQEKDSSQNVQQQTFEYVENRSKQFYEQLRAYMSKHINLSPRYQTVK
jgi:hypothetical protein